MVASKFPQYYLLTAYQREQVGTIYKGMKRFKIVNIRKLSLLLLLALTLSNCWLDNTHTDYSAAKSHMQPSDKLNNTERDGYIIVKNKGKYYRISPSGTRTEVKIQYHRR